MFKNIYIYINNVFEMTLFILYILLPFPFFFFLKIGGFNIIKKERNITLP